MVGLARFHPDKPERCVDVAGTGEGNQQGLVPVITRLVHDQEFARSIGPHGRSFHAYLDATRASIGDQAREDQQVGIAGKPLEFVLMNPGDARPVFLMTAGPGLEGDVDLGTHRRRCKEQGGNTAEGVHPAKAG